MSLDADPSLLLAPRKLERQYSAKCESRVKRRLSFDNVQPLLCPAAVAVRTGNSAHLTKQPVMPTIAETEDKDASSQQLQQQRQRHGQPEAEPACVSVGVAAHAKELPNAGLCKMLLQSEE